MAGPWCAVAVDVNWQLTPHLLATSLRLLLVRFRQAGGQENTRRNAVQLFALSCRHVQVQPRENENENGLEIIRMRPLLREVLQPANETPVRAALATC